MHETSRDAVAELLGFGGCSLYKKPLYVPTSRNPVAATRNSTGSFGPWAHRRMIPARRIRRRYSLIRSSGRLLSSTYSAAMRLSSPSRDAISRSCSRSFRDRLNRSFISPSIGSVSPFQYLTNCHNPNVNRAVIASSALARFFIEPFSAHTTSKLGWSMLRKCNQPTVEFSL